MGWSDGLDTRCGGSGILICRCMGDGCCCDFHGYAECLGCPDCEGEPDYYEDDPLPADEADPERP